MWIKYSKRRIYCAILNREIPFMVLEIDMTILSHIFTYNLEELYYLDMGPI